MEKKGTVDNPFKIIIEANAFWDKNMPPRELTYAEKTYEPLKEIFDDREKRFEKMANVDHTQTNNNNDLFAKFKRALDKSINGDKIAIKKSKIVTKIAGYKSIIITATALITISLVAGGFVHQGIQKNDTVQAIKDSIPAPQASYTLGEIHSDNNFHYGGATLDVYADTLLNSEHPLPIALIVAEDKFKEFDKNTHLNKLYSNMKEKVALDPQKYSQSTIDTLAYASYDDYEKRFGETLEDRENAKNKLLTTYALNEEAQESFDKEFENLFGSIEPGNTDGGR